MLHIILRDAGEYRNWNRLRDSGLFRNPFSFLRFNAELARELRDVDGAQAYVEAMQILHINHIISGNDEGYIRPNDYLTRVEAATILFNAVTPWGDTTQAVFNPLRPNLIPPAPPLELGENHRRAVLFGAYARTFTTEIRGDFTFTADSIATDDKFAPIVFEIREDETPRYRALHQFPVPAEGGGLQVTHRLDAGVTVIVAVSGLTVQDFVLEITEVERPVYVRPVRVTVKDIYGTHRAFASRSGRHAGIDFVPAHNLAEGLVAPFPNIYAVADGEVIRYAHFYRGTYALEIRKDDGRIVRYCELHAVGGVYVGARVEQGQIIALMGRMTGISEVMLHLEYYKGTATGSLTQPGNRTYNYVASNNLGRRRDLLDPTFFFHLP